MSRPAPISTIVVVCSLVVGCHLGVGTADFPPAVTPHGIETNLQLRSTGELHGELLEVRDTAFVLLVDRGVILAPFASVRGGSFRDSDIGYGGGMPSEATRRRLRLVSRFPHGMPSVVLAAILRDAGQTELVRRP